ncbi:MAG: hypothetical protein QXS76_00080 [Candidatus Bathyarchaeia archaeon]
MANRTASPDGEIKNVYLFKSKSQRAYFLIFSSSHFPKIGREWELKEKWSVREFRAFGLSRLSSLIDIGENEPMTALHIPFIRDGEGYILFPTTMEKIHLSFYF